MADPWYKRLVRAPFVQSAAGNGLAAYLWLVDRTVRKVQADLEFERKDLAEHLPFIMTFWHGEHFMVAPAAPRAWNLHVMISRSADGSINASAVKRFGIKPVRGAGASTKRAKQKGGAGAFLQFLKILENGGSVAQTADAPKVARQVSPGLIKLARKSGRPIVPAAYVTHPRVVLNSWDKASVALPFTKAAVGTGAPIYIPEDDEQDDGAWCAIVHQKLTDLERHGYAEIGGASAFADEPLRVEGSHHG